MPSPFVAWRAGDRPNLIALLVACGSTHPRRCCTLACDDGIRTAFKPGGDTTVVAVRQIKKGEALIAQDSAVTDHRGRRPVPGQAAGRPRRHCRDRQLRRARTPRASASRSGCPRRPTGTNASATTAAAAGSAAATAMPTRSAARCRRSSMPTWATRRAPPMPASRGTRTARSRFCPTARSTPSRFATSRRARWSSRPSRPRPWRRSTYGKAPKYTYYDGHSQGGRQGLKVDAGVPRSLRRLPDRPALRSVRPMFGTTALYPQIVMKTELGYTAADKAQAAALRQEGGGRQPARGGRTATRRAWASCSTRSAATTTPRATPARCAPAWPATASPAATPMPRPA